MLVQTVKYICCLVVWYNLFFTHFVDTHVEHIDTEFTLKETLSEKEQKFGESVFLPVYLLSFVHAAALYHVNFDLIDLSF